MLENIPSYTRFSQTNLEKLFILDSLLQPQSKAPGWTKFSICVDNASDQSTSVAWKRMPETR